MSIRNTWNRMLRRSSTTSTSSEPSSSPASTAPSSPGWGPSATFSWLVPGSKSSGTTAIATQLLAATAAPPKKHKEKRLPTSAADKKNKKNKRLHPSERPLTKENLRHQEMFAHFTFGEPGCSNANSARHSFESGISPCGSRRASFAAY